MVSSPNYVRNYRQEYATETAKRRRERALRNKARRTMAKRLGARNIEGKDIDHIRPFDKGGSNRMSNLRPRSRRANRSFKRNQRGGMK